MRRILLFSKFVDMFKNLKKCPPLTEFLMTAINAGASVKKYKSPSGTIVYRAVYKDSGAVKIFSRDKSGYVKKITSPYKTSPKSRGFRV